MTDIRVPTLGESVTEATIGKWFKKPGDAVAVDEPLVELETDKVTIEVPAPAAGVLAEIAAKDGETVAVGALLGAITPAAGGARCASRGARRRAGSGSPSAGGRRRRLLRPQRLRRRQQRRPRSRQPMHRRRRRCAASPAKSGIEPAAVAGTGKDGRITKGDMLAAIERAAMSAGAGRRSRRPRCRSARRRRADDAAREERVRMTRLRQTIARRLKEAQNTAAMLTTFNEVDMAR